MGENHGILICAAGTLCVSVIVTHFLVPWVRRLGLARDMLDHPGGRKQHDAPVPRIGGVAMVFGLLMGFGSGYLGFLALGNPELPDFATHELLVLGIATLIIFVVGLLDDLHELSVFWKLLCQIVAAGLIVPLGWQIESISLPMLGAIELPGLLAVVITLIWVVGVTNAINLIDGLDGLAGGIAAIVSVSLMLFAFFQGNPGTVLLTTAMAGACLGFLPHNWQPAKVYLGDAGSLTLGFLLATVSLHASIKASAAVAIFVPLLALGLPVIDTLLVMGVRFLERSGDSLPGRFARMFQADRQHIHHLALVLAPKRSLIVLCLYGFVAVFCAAALVMVERNWGTGIAIAILVTELVCVLLIRSLGMRKVARKLALAQRDEARELVVSTLQDEPSAEDDPALRSAESGREVLVAVSSDTPSPSRLS
ncbi:MAG: MraY family glycosyltransferase [Acidobacteriota bacterium]